MVNFIPVVCVRVYIPALGKGSILSEDNKREQTLGDKGAAERVDCCRRRRGCNPRPWSVCLYTLSPNHRTHGSKSIELKTFDVPTLHVAQANKSIGILS